MVFILFDIEAIFLYPWAVVYRDQTKALALPFFEMLLFIALVLCGFFYIWKKGVLELDLGSDAHRARSAARMTSRSPSVLPEIAAENPTALAIQAEYPEAIVDAKRAVDGLVLYIAPLQLLPVSRLLQKIGL